MKLLIIHQGRILNSKIEEFKKKYGYSKITKVNLKLSESKISDKNFNYDKFCHSVLLEDINSNYDLIVIYNNLNDFDYSGMYGLRIAAHLRLTKELKNTHSPIVILSSDTLEEILFINSLGSILLTSGIHLSSNFDYTFIIENNSISENQYNDFLNKLSVPNIDNNDNRHSIVNELSLYNWSKAIGLSLDEIDAEVSSNLYYKLMFAKNESLKNLSVLDEANPSLAYELAQRKFDAKMYVFLIDDEAEKGWGKFYTHLFKLIEKEPNQAKLMSIPITKGVSQADVIDQCVQKIKKSLRIPNIVLLDLRLVDSDFEREIDSRNLTGIKIAKEIESYNPAIQIVFTTASNKISSYLSASKLGLGIDGYVIKAIDQHNNKNILHLIETLEYSYSKSLFLISIQEKFNKLKSLLLLDSVDDSEDNKLSDFQLESIANIDLVFKMLYRSSGDDILIDFAYLQLFMLLENFSKKNELIEISDLKISVFSSRLNQWKVVLLGEIYQDKLRYRKTLLWNQIQSDDYAFKGDYTNSHSFEKVRNRVFLILWFKFSVFDKNELWHNLNDHRNNIAHGLSIDRTISAQERVKELLDFILFIFNNKNERI